MWKILRPDVTAVLDDELAKKSLARYFAVMQNEKTAKFMIAKELPAEFEKNDSLEELWNEHAKCAEEFCKIEHEIDMCKNFHAILTAEESCFDLKIEMASRILQSCHLCSRRCGVNRMVSGLRYCACGNAMIVSSIFEHVGEEPE